MFKPKYKYSDQMIGLLTRIAAAREVILGCAADSPVGNIPAPGGHCSQRTFFDQH